MTSTPPTASDQRATVVAGFLGWTLDAFDFFLVVMTLTAIAKEFGKSDAAISGRRVGAAATGLCVGLSARGVMLPHAVPALRLAAAVLHRRPARAARTVRARAGEGVGGVAGDTARELERTR